MEFLYQVPLPIGSVILARPKYFRMFKFNPQEVFPVRHRVQTGSVAYSASWPIGTWGFYTSGKAAKA
jgi:hypothetical protein